MLSGYRAIGKVKCVGGGHELTSMLLRKSLKLILNFQLLNWIKSYLKKSTIQTSKQELL